MTALVQALQLISGALWLLPAVFLSRHIVRTFRPGADRLTSIQTRNAFVAWLMVGYVVRWLLWSHSIAGMETTELVTWGALYALSSVCGAWFFRDALTMRKR